jgi:hypothetical protein
MKHLTKDINQLGRQIAIRILTLFDKFDVPDMKEAMSQYFIEGTHDGKPVGLKILTKASVNNQGHWWFQMDDEVVRKINAIESKYRSRKIVIVLVDTRTRAVSYGYFDDITEGNTQYFEPSKTDGPVWWNLVEKLKYVGNMSDNERDKLMELRIRNRSDKNQKTIFDK